MSTLSRGGSARAFVEEEERSRQIAARLCNTKATSLYRSHTHKSLRTNLHKRHQPQPRVSARLFFSRNSIIYRPILSSAAPFLSAYVNGLMASCRGHSCAGKRVAEKAQMCARSITEILLEMQSSQRGARLTTLNRFAWYA